MEPLPSFRTKTGLCVIHPDRLELERTGARGALAGALFSGSVNRALGYYSVLVVLLLVMAAMAAFRRDFLQTGLFVVGAAFLLRSILKSRGLSAAPVLPRAAITRIEAHPPVAPVTRAHFIVHFTEQGRALRRLVILPGTLEGGTAEYARALELLKREGLPLSP